uniref:Uncharacterized protein n=1 Tax=Arundo donax TaxID=35708 RepID=A0A0A9DJN2_ARUDO
MKNSYCTFTNKGCLDLPCQGKGAQSPLLRGCCSCSPSISLLSMVTSEQQYLHCSVLTVQCSSSIFLLPKVDIVKEVANSRWLYKTVFSVQGTKFVYVSTSSSV